MRSRSDDDVVFMAPGRSGFHEYARCVPFGHVELEVTLLNFVLLGRLQMIVRRRPVDDGNGHPSVGGGSQLDNYFVGVYFW